MAIYYFLSVNRAHLRTEGELIIVLLNPATIQRYTFLPSVLDLEKSFKVEMGWLG